MPTVGGIVLARAVSVKTGTVENTTLANADQEYSHAFPATTKMFNIQSRTNGTIKLSFTSGESGTTYWTIAPGQNALMYNYDGTSTITLYMQSPQAGNVVELMSWK